MLTLHHAPLTGGFSHLEFDVAVKRLRIYDQQEAIRLAEAGLLYWEDAFGISKPYACDGEFLLQCHFPSRTRCYRLHILVDEEDE